MDLEKEQKGRPSHKFQNSRVQSSVCCCFTGSLLWEEIALTLIIQQKSVVIHRNPGSLRKDWGSEYPSAPEYLVNSLQHTLYTFLHGEAWPVAISCLALIVPKQCGEMAGTILKTLFLTLTRVSSQFLILLFKPLFLYLSRVDLIWREEDNSPYITVLHFLRNHI